ncbi:sugar ABC transporter ATP-binding protein [Aestuariivirga sp.]|uniref:sugar ABC transporter ATP-binding protein n=1 Tax=Aestuariivirga sp. TaxID=2650926 RepID=UPI0039E2AC03
MTSTLLTLEAVSKTFGPVVALEDVSFSIGRGEVVGLVGENGAGKSTLMKILGGVITPSSGRVLIEGREIHFANARHSMNEGIAFVHQELNSFPNLSVAANILIGREPRKGPFDLFVDEKKAEALVQPLLQKLRADFTPSTPVADLSIAQRQLVEIARALSFDARLVIMDEPTSSLTLSESNRLLEIVGELKAAGVSVIFITHRLNEIVEIADRVVVLRDGRLAGTLKKSEISPQAMIAHMIGRTLQTLYLPPAITSAQDGLTLICVRTENFPQEEITLSVRRGEILGLAGLIGAGRSELAKAIFGIEPLLAGEIRINGSPVQVTTPGEAIAAGVALIPEDRKQSALLLAESIAENIGLNNWQQFSRGGLVDAGELRGHAARQIQAFDVHAPGPDAHLSALSGGNQQKVILAKWLPRNPAVLICDEPTRGVDVGARHEIYLRLRKAADAGAAVLLISSDMEEVLGVSDRIAVMHEGRISGTLQRENFSEHNVLQLAVGRANQGDHAE